jgi:hypothetical protein
VSLDVPHGEFDLREPLHVSPVSAATIFGRSSDQGPEGETSAIDEGDSGWVSHERSIPISEASSTETASTDVDTDLSQFDFAGLYPDLASGHVQERSDNLVITETTAIIQEDKDHFRLDEEAIAQEARNKNSARELQLVMVVLFGLIALAVIYLDDPTAVDSLRESFDSLRN